MARIALIAATSPGKRVDVRWYAAALLLIPVMITVVFVAGSLMRGSRLPTPAISLGAVLFMVLIQTPTPSWR